MLWSENKLKDKVVEVNSTMVTTKRPRRSNRKKSGGIINVTASSTISPLPSVPQASASNSAPLLGRQMPPAPPPPWMQPPPSASTTRTTSTTHLFQPLLPYPYSLVPSSQQLAATAAPLSSPRPLSTPARAALPSTLSSASTAPPLPQWTKRQKQYHDGRSHSINATPTILNPPLLPAVSSSAIAAASTAPSLVPWMQHPPTSTNQRKRSNEFIEEDDSATYECGAASISNQKDLPPTIAQQSVSRKTKQYPLRSKHLPPVQVTKKDDTREKKIMRIVVNMMNLDERKKNYPEDSKRLHVLCDLFQRFALLFYKKFVSEHGLEKRPLPKDADDRGGSYVFYYDNGDKHGKRDKRLTAGQTTNFVRRGKDRIKKQRGGDGDITITKEEVEQQMALLFTTVECVGIANSPGFCVIFEEIVAMHHPRLACYASAGKEEKRRERIARGLIEGAVGASTDAFIYRAYEDFLEKPSDEILRIISSPEVDQEYAECVGSIQYWLPFFTWEHFVSYLRRCANNKEELSPDQLDFLRQVIIDLDREFLQKHIYDRTMGGEGVTIMPFVDAVPGSKNPRVIELMNVVEELKELLSETVMESIKEEGAIPPDVAESVKEIVNGISKDDYVSPSDHVLAEGYASGLRSLKQQYRGQKHLAITFEFVKYDVICKDEGLKKELFGDCETLKQDDIDGNTAEIFLRSDIGPSFRIIHSSHVGLGENQTDVQRVNSVQRTMTTMTVNNQAGILKDATLEKERRTYCAFFMNWFGFGGSLNGRDGSFYLARTAAVGDGICSPHVVRAGAQMTGNAIGRGISGPATAFLRCLLERDRFDTVLTICRGEITNEDNPSPIDDPDQREVWAKDRERQRYHARSEEERERDREYNRRRYQERSEEERERDREYNRRRYQERSEEKRERDREYDRRRYQERSEEERERDREYRQQYNQSAHGQMMSRLWREKNVGRIREQQQQWRKSERGREHQQQWRKSERGRALQQKYQEKQKEKRAQESQKRKDDKADSIPQKARAAYKQYLELKGKNRLNQLSRSSMFALLKYISQIDPKVKYIEGTVEKTRERLGISLSDTNDSLSKYFNP